MIEMVHPTPHMYPHLFLHLFGASCSGFWKHAGNNFIQIGDEGKTPRLISGVELSRCQNNELTDVGPAETQ